MQILRRFGGGALRDTLSDKDEFEKRLQKNTLILNDLDARLAAIDIGIDVKTRRQINPRNRNVDDKHN